MRHGIELDSAEYAGRRSSRQAVFGGDTAADDGPCADDGEDGEPAEGSESADEFGNDSTRAGDEGVSTDGFEEEDGDEEGDEPGADEVDQAAGAAEAEALAGDVDGREAAKVRFRPG